MRYDIIASFAYRKTKNSYSGKHKDRFKPLQITEFANESTVHCYFSKNISFLEHENHTKNSASNSDYIYIFSMFVLFSE